MRKIFKLVPALAVTLTAGAIPLVSCNKGEDRTPLCFTDVADDNISSSVEFTVTGSLPDIDIEYSYDSLEWNSWNISTPIQLNNGESVYVRNTTNFLNDSNNTFQFVMTGKIAASGNVNSMIAYGTLTDYCFSKMFSGCSSLVEAPKLPAKQLAEACYFQMFADCTSLTSAPELPAAKLEYGCYVSMFLGCTALVQPPQLPVKQLVWFCYAYMFSGCTSLTTIPDLPSEELANYCYAYMFSGCTSLTTTINLPATTLVPHCYEHMFEDCTSLTSIANLPATTLKESCYKSMFEGCSSLDVYETEIDNASTSNLICNFTTIASFPENSVKDMFANTSGAFVGTPINKAYCWINDLKFTVLDSETTFSYTASFVDISGIQYSSDGGISWDSWGQSTSLTLEPGQSLYVRNTNNKLSCSAYNVFTFIIPNRVACSGDVRSMINYGDLSDYCFCQLFWGCRYLVTAPDLPSIKLAPHCYYSMFMNCTALTTAPKLPATELADCCYKQMFYGCSSLKISQTTGTNLMCDFTNVDLSFEESVLGMFTGTGGSFKGTPTNNKYFWN